MAVLPRQSRRGGAIVLAADAKLPKGHQTWQLNEINGLIWPSPNGIGTMDKAAFDQTAQVAHGGRHPQGSPRCRPPTAMT